MFLFYLIGVPVVFMVDAALIKWLTWALDNAGIIEHTVTYGQACTIMVPIAAWYLVSGFVKGFTD